MTSSYSHRRDERGAAATIFAAFLSSSVLFALGALAVDIGQMYEMRRSSQTAADMSALAGGAVLKSDPTDACIAALEYLRKNNPKGTSGDVSAIPADDQCSATGTPANAVDTNGDGSGDAPVVSITSGLQTTIRVVLPRQRVNFGFANAFGISGSDVTAGATVALRSTGALMPFAVPSGCLGTAPDDWYFSVKTDSTATSADLCGPNQGNFGLVNIGGGGGGSAEVVDAIRDGTQDLTYIETTPSDWTSAPDDPACPTSSGDEGDTGMIGTTNYTANWDNDSSTEPSAQPIPNCLAIESGLKASSLEEGLIKSSHGCDGRLVISDSTSVRAYDSCKLDDQRFAEFWLAAESSVRAGLPGTISNRILKSKNFMAVPLIYAAKRPGSGGGNGDGWVPVVDIMGLFLDCWHDDPLDKSNRSLCTNPFGDTSGQIKELNGYVFDLDAIEVGPNDGVTTRDYYTGSGAAVPVLIRDPLN